MKKIPLLLLAFAMYSCTDDVIIASESENPMATISPQYVADGKYDALGQGYDVTGEYLSDLSVRPSVIDIAKFEQEEGERIIPSNTATTYFKHFFGSDAKEYVGNLGLDLSTNGTLFKGAFGATITAKYASKKEYSAHYSFASSYMIKRIKWLYLNADTQLLSRYLSQKFTEDLSSKTAQQIVEIYGTHVLTDIKIGGRLKTTYRSASTSTSKTESVKAGMKSSFFKVFGLDLGYNTETSLETSNVEHTLEFVTEGGVNSIVGVVDLNKGIQSIDIASWHNSVNVTNSTLVDADWKKAIPIYDLVTDPIKKEQLRNAVLDYIKAKQFDIVFPIYGYMSDSYNNHFYTTSFSELGLGGSTYRYEGIIGYLYKDPIPGTTAVHRFVRNGVMKDVDHYYSISYNPTQMAESGYRYEGIIGYAYANQVPGTIPVFSYMNDSKIDHYYSIYYDVEALAKSGYRYEGVAWYCFPTNI